MPPKTLTMDFSNHSRAADKEPTAMTSLICLKLIDYASCVSDLLSGAHRLLTRRESGHSIGEVVGRTIEALSCEGQFSDGLLGQRHRRDQ